MKRIWNLALGTAVLCTALLCGCALSGTTAPDSAAPTDPLTGQELQYPGERTAAVVIDNAASSTTQWGIGSASVVLEALTESGQPTSLCLAYPSVSAMPTVGPVTLGQDLYWRLLSGQEVLPIQRGAGQFALVAEFISRLEFGGAEAMLLNYTTHFQHPEQFDLHIITQDINDDDCIRQFEDAGYTVHIVTHKRKSIAKNVGEVYQVLKQEHFDIAHSHMTLTNFYVLLLAKMLGVRVRISHAHSAFREDNLKAKLAFPILKSLNRLAANVWMACGYDAGVFLYGTDAVDHQKVYMMRNAIDLQRFQRNDKTRQMIREKYAIGDALCVGHVGRFCTPKNHSFVLEIFNAVRKITPASKFLLVGDGELRGEVLAKIKELHLENSVVLTGNVTNTNELYQAMDAFILPSLYEGLPVVSIEAQAANLPCLISENVDHRCAMTSNVHFLSIQKSADEWAKEILKYAAQPHSDDSIEALTKAGYNIETEARKLEELYKNSINKQE